MRERTRRFFIWASWIGLCVSLSMLLGLRLGRPLFYTDGESEWFAASHLRDASMLAWPTAEPEFELPGPVRGRVAELPDGRLMYGRGKSDGTTDLVVFDPQRPGLPPEPALGLNGPGHDLAPALGPDRELYFASDRTGGVGGFDLWTARWVDGIFTAPVPAPEGVNSELDETDPAPDSLGLRLAFARRDPAEDEGRNGELWIVDRGGATEPRRLFPFERHRRADRQPIDRDPAFSTDGVSLWFVRQGVGQTAQVMRTWRNGDGFADPVAHPALGGAGSLRAPAPLGDGLRLRLLKPGAPALTYVSIGYELYPWWEAQRTLELILLGFLLVCALLLVLLYLGRRWHQLDLVTQCLLLSLLLHLLILLWLAQMEIVRRFMPGEPAEGGVEVELIAGRSENAQGGGQVAQQKTDLSHGLAFRGHQRELTASPDASADFGRDLAAERSGAHTPDGSWQRELDAQRDAATTEVQDAAAALALRNGPDSPTAPAAQAEASAVADAQAAAVAEDRAEAVPRVVRVVEPSSELAGATPVTPSERTRVAEAAGGHTEQVPRPRPVTAPQSAPRDSGTPAMALRTGAGERAAPVGLARPLAATGSAQAAPVDAARQASQSGAQESPTAPRAAVDPSAPVRRVAPVVAVRSEAAPEARTVAAAVPELQDPVAVRSAPRAAADAPVPVAVARAAAATPTGAGPSAAAAAERAASAPRPAAPTVPVAATGPASAARQAVPGAQRRTELPQGRPTQSVAALRDAPASSSAAAGAAALEPRAVVTRKEIPSERPQPPVGVAAARSTPTAPGDVAVGAPASPRPTLAAASRAQPPVAEPPRGRQGSAQPRSAAGPTADLRDAPDVAEQPNGAQESPRARPLVPAAVAGLATPAKDTGIAAERAVRGATGDPSAAPKPAAPGTELVAAPSPATPGSRSQRRPQALRARGGGPMATLRDAPIDAADPSGSPAGGAPAVAAVRARADVTPDRQDAVLAAARAVRDEPSDATPASAVQLPPSDLAAGGRRHSGPDRRAASLPKARPLAAGPMLRDRPRERAVAPGGAKVPTGSGEAPRAALAAVVEQPFPATIVRPDRGTERLEGPDAESRGIAVPGSFLGPAERRRAVTASARPAVAAADTPYSNRFGPAKANALERFGGTAETERAVALGLRYLAGIQNEDGSWGNPRRWDSKYGRSYIGKSALCLLAFLGAGHTPTSRTEYSDVVKKAIDRLLALQDDETGAFGRTSAYSHGITTYALAECYGITRDRRLLRPVEQGLSWILAHQSPRRDRRNLGGWGYFSTAIEAEDSYSRVSVSSWMVMALESARMSGIEIPDDALPAARRYLRNSFDRRKGWFRYNHDPSRLNSEWPTLPASTPAAAFCLMLLGEDSDEESVHTALDFTLTRRPQRFRRYSEDDFVLRGQGNVYFWYYGSLACFLAGGETWARWNERLSTVLPRGQSDDGSFRPIGAYAGYAGDTNEDRSYTTAMCVLSLEVYYRYFTPLLLGR